MTRSRSTVPLPARLAMAIAVLVAGGACSSSGFEDRTARVELGDRRLTFEVDSCGLDGQTAFVVGRADGGEVVQAAVGVEDDGETGVPASTGVTVTDEDGVEWGSFGAEAWSRREGQGAAPGRIESARVKGSRIQAAGTAQVIEDDRTTGAEPVPFTFDARCDE